MSDAVGLLVMLVPGTALVGGILAWARRGSSIEDVSGRVSLAPVRSAAPVHRLVRWVPFLLFCTAGLLGLILGVLVERPLSPVVAFGILGLLGPGFLGLVWAGSRGFFK